MVGHLVLLQAGIVHIDRCDAFLLGNEGVLGLLLEELAGQEEAFACGDAQATIDMDDAMRAELYSSRPRK